MPFACMFFGHRMTYGVIASWPSVIVGRYYANGWHCDRCGELDFGLGKYTTIDALPGSIQ